LHCNLGPTAFLLILLKQDFSSVAPYGGLSCAWKKFSSIPNLYPLHNISNTHTHTQTPSVVTTKNVYSHLLPNVPWWAIFPLVGNHGFKAPNFLAPGHSHMGYLYKQGSLDYMHGWLFLFLQISTKHLLFGTFFNPFNLKLFRPL